MSSSPLVQGLPRLEIDINHTVPVLKIQPAHTLESLIFQGAKQRAARFYKTMMLPDYPEAYLVEADAVPWAFDLLAQNPQYLSRAVHRFVSGQDPSRSHILDTDQPKQIMAVLSSLMARQKIMLREDSQYDSLRALTWPRNGLPFMRRHTVMNHINRLRDSRIARLDNKAWIPNPDPHARLLLGINHWRVLVDLSENFAASVSEYDQTSSCRQFENREELSDWLHRIAGQEGIVSALAWNQKLQMPKLSCLSSLREWSRHLSEADRQHPPAQLQLGFDNSQQGAWEWLGGQAAFCEPVRHRMQGHQEDNHSLRMQMLMHQTGPLVHPGFPEQPHRLHNDAPGVEFYRPLNPFRREDHGQDQ